MSVPLLNSSSLHISMLLIENVKLQSNWQSRFYKYSLSMQFFLTLICFFILAWIQLFHIRASAMRTWCHIWRVNLWLLSVKIEVFGRNTVCFEVLLCVQVCLVLRRRDLKLISSRRIRTFQARPDWIILLPSMILFCTF